MTIHDSSVAPSATFQERGAALWNMAGPLFSTVWPKGDDRSRVTLCYRGVPMAVLREKSVDLFIRVDADGPQEVNATDESLREYVNTVSHLDIILRAWPVVKAASTHEYILMANDTEYGRVTLSAGCAGYLLVPGNRTLPQRTNSLANLEKYTEWLNEAIANRESSHTVLFIDSMRRL